MITIINYNAGNIKSVTNALDAIGAKWKITSDAREIAKAQKIIMPGVGSAASAMKELRKRDLVSVIQNTRAPFLGVCLGMQLLFEWSDEGDTGCLGIIKGRVKKFQGERLNVPQMGWNNVKLKTDKTENIFGSIEDSSYFYFVHSYYCVPDDLEIITATTEYGIEFASAVQWRNFYGVQFHPEKSGEVGLEVLKNFCKIYDNYPRN
jgi:glutamine amidotransferase